MKRVKLKYYLRGLGIGILVTALIMGFVTKDNRPLTDAEIKAAAAGLGMVESDSLRLADLPQDQTTEPVKKPEDIPESGEETSSGPEKESETAAEDTAEQEKEPETTAEDTAEQEKEPETAMEDTAEATVEPEEASESTAETTQESGTDISVTVSAGSGSRTVCNRLEEAGVITDAAEFDKYLCDQGYSKRICVGTFEIPADASWEEIAKIITRSK